MMRLTILLLALLACMTVVVVGNTTRLSAVFVADDKESKTQPKEVTLAKDTLSDKYGEVAFNHENHATKMYSIDGKSVMGCAECHHTDQPAADLKPPLKTSSRNAALTAALLATADAAPVKSCRACHLQAGDDSAPNPTVVYEGDKTGKPTKLTNDVAYHNNCNVCHDKAIAARPTLKGKIPGTNDCLTCHKPVS
jgi:hypothetical protein